MASHRKQPPRKYYQLTPQGHRALTHETAHWQRQQGAITRILEA
jgi:DNA-binding PadR family transcriptional regulator